MEPNRKLKLIVASTLSIIFGIWLIDYGITNKAEVILPSPILPISDIPSASPSAVLGEQINGKEIMVNRVVDGDTIELSDGKKLRYIGIDTPETVDPRRPVGCFGKEASLENKKLVEGKKVILVKDVSDTDKFSRLLRYVYLIQADGSEIFINDYLVREGFARASTYPPDVKFSQQFLEAERQAKEGKKGLWQKCQ